MDLNKPKRGRPRSTDPEVRQRAIERTRPKVKTIGKVKLASPLGRRHQHHYKILDQDWTDHPGQKPLGRIERIISIADTKQRGLLDSMSIPTELPPTNFATLYGLDRKKQWKQLGFKCYDCGITVQDPEVVVKHGLVCTKQLKINKEKEDEE